MRGKLATIQSVAVVDDDPNEVEVMTELLMDAGFKSVPFYEEFADPPSLAAEIEKRAQAAVCDHRLRPLGLATFDGAELVAELFTRKIPAVLVTTYLDMDSDVSIRRWRHRIPVLLSRDNAGPDSIRQALAECLRELRGSRSRQRVARRALVRVVDITNESRQEVIDSIIPQWNPHRGIRFPALLLPDELRKSVGSGTRLLADVNIGSEVPEDVYLSNFTLAPEPVPDDELA